jgi:hypothetical protein
MRRLTLLIVLAALLAGATPSVSQAQSANPASQPTPPEIIALMCSKHRPRKKGFRSPAGQYEAA